MNEALKEGKPQAFRELFRETYPRLMSYCRLFVPDQQQAKDLVQECFIKLWEKRQSIKPMESIESFLFVMLRNRCLNYLRDQKVGQGKISLWQVGENEFQYLYQLDFLHKEERALEEELVEALQNAINNLPERRKLVFIKNKINGQKQAEISRELKISLQAVEKHLQLAKKQMYNELTKQFPSLVFLISFLFDQDLF